MGAGNSSLEGDVTRLNRDLEDHLDEYKLFPSKDGVKLRERVDELKNDTASNLNFSDINGLSTGLSTLSTNFGTLQRELDAVKFQHTLIVGEQCEVTLACPLAGNYATAISHNALSDRVGMSATGSQAATGLFRTVQDTKNSADDTNDRLGMGGDNATGLFKTVQDIAGLNELTLLLADETNLRLGGSAAGGTGLFKTVKDNRDLADETNVRLGMGGVSATGLFKTVKDNRDLADETNVRLGMGGVSATGLFKTVKDNRDLADKTNVRLGMGGDNATGLFKTVQDNMSALDRKISLNATVQPVDVTEFYTGKPGVAMRWTACYANHDGKQNSAFQKDCARYGAGWKHDTGVVSNKQLCLKIANTDYHMGVCYKPS